MQLTKFAQSTILLTRNDERTLLIDPGKYNLGEGLFDVSTVPTADTVVITHKHADHFDMDILRSLLQRSTPHLITNTEIATQLRSDGHTCTELSPGDTCESNGFTLTAIRTDHVVRDESIINFGLVIAADNTALYYTSDTRFIDPSLLPLAVRTPYLMVPISNRGVVMGVDDAFVFATELRPRVTIPMHYDSPKDVDRVHPAEFLAKLTAAGLAGRALSFGETLSLD